MPRHLLLLASKDWKWDIAACLWAQSPMDWDGVEFPLVQQERERVALENLLVLQHVAL
jgi:hypothetical protein